MKTNVQTSTGKTPDYKRLVFTFNPETRYFQMTTGELGFSKVPNELKLEETQKKSIIHSDYLIRGRIINGKYSFFTGLLKTNFEHWYFGDFFEIRNGIKKNSFILFHFSKDQTRFVMFFFNHFKLYPDRRGHFIRDFINGFKR
jgi:hypothetical protein